MNLPYLAIYKGDYLRQNVSGCTIAAQGLWLRLMILMHDSERPGYLSLNGEPMPPRLAAVKCSVSLDEYSTLLTELDAVRAFARTTEGILYSPQIVAEVTARSQAAERQRRFKQKREGNGEVTPEVTEKKREGNAVSSSSISDSVPNGTGAAAPSIWDVGVPLLTRGGVMTDKNARSLLGKMAKEYGTVNVAAALGRTSHANPANPHEYFVATLTREQKPRSAAEMNRGGKGVVL